PAFFDRQLTADPGLVAFAQVLDLRPQSLGDHEEQANRWTRLAHLHLVQERAGEGVAHDRAEAHPAALAELPATLSQRAGPHARTPSTRRRLVRPNPGTRSAADLRRALRKRSIRHAHPPHAPPPPSSA